MTEHVVKPGMVCLDVGANMGYYTMLLAKLAGPTGRVYAAETSIDACEVILRQARVNGFQQVFLFAGFALSDQDLPGTSGLFFNYSWPPAAVDQRGNLAVTAKADTLLRGVDRLDFVKIDVDGWERKVLAGSWELLARFHPALLLEVCDYTLQAACGMSGKPEYPYGREVRAMLGDLRDLGYQFFWEEDLKPVASIETVLTRFNLAACSTNLLCLPR